MTGRSIWMLAEFLQAAFTFVIHCGIVPSNVDLRKRTNWLHHTARRLLRVFSVDVHAVGPIPSKGLLVCNHLSYVDILVLASLAPCVFVAKKDVRSWPVFGWFAVLAGTLFVNREKRSHVSAANAAIQAALDQGALVVLFPEGTSSGGETVLAFKSSLLEPATRPGHSLSVGFLGYELEDGNVSEEVCYWKDMTLVPHLINLLGKRSVFAAVRFGQLRDGSPDRKELARQLHSEVLRLADVPTKGPGLKRAAVRAVRPDAA